MSSPYAIVLSPEDDALLDDLSRRAVRFFWETAAPETGLIPDRGRAFPLDGETGAGPVASIAAVGFGLAGLCIAAERGWLAHAAVEARCEATLRFLANAAEQEHGFLYHFLSMETGKRAWGCELSSIDTGLLLNGALVVRQYFPGTTAAALAERLYHRVNWPWLATGPGGVLGMGWTPERGFIPNAWQHYSEHMALHLLAIGAPDYPLPAQVWHEWKREPWIEYAGWRYLHYPPLFAHQFAHAFIDFRGRRDAYADYGENSRAATLAQRQFCLDLAPRFPGCYTPDSWGLTSSDSMGGYVDWGGPPLRPNDEPDKRIDGTVVPCAAGGSLPFAPRECLDVLHHLRARFGEKIYGPYGFADAFHPTLGWVNPDVLGIDLGIMLLMAENLRTGFVWRMFEANPEVRHGLELGGFTQARPDRGGS